MIKDKPHAIDKWAQETTHMPKCKVGEPTGRPADLSVGSTAFRFYVEASYWLVMAV